MRLCDKDIETYLEKEIIQISPRPASSAISGVSVDLHLGNSFRVFRDHKAPYIDLSGPREQVSKALHSIMSKEIILKADNAFFLHPGELALAVTLESITLPDNIVAWLDGRSSLARLGLMVHVTAHRIDPGWSGIIVLEVFNAGKIPLALRPNMIICAINFELMSDTAIRPYYRRKNAKYHKQNHAQASKINEE